MLALRTLKRCTLAALLCLAASTFSPAHAEEKISIGLIAGSPALYWPTEIGKERGIFAAEGLTIDPVYVPSSSGVIQQLAAGSLDIAVAGMIDPLRAIEKGGAIAILRTEGAVPPYSLFARPEIKKIEDLKGKTISVGGLTDITRIYVERMLKPHGVLPGQFDMVFAGTTSARYAALESGAVAATILGAPADNRAAAAGYTNLGLTMEYVKDLPFSGYAVNRAWAAAHLGTVKKFLTAYQKSLNWFYDDAHRDDAIKTVVDLSHDNVESITKSYEFFRKIEFFEKSEKVSTTDLQTLVTVLTQLGVLEHAIPTEALIMKGVTPTE